MACPRVVAVEMSREALGIKLRKDVKKCGCEAGRSGGCLPGLFGIVTWKTQDIMECVGIGQGVGRSQADFPGWAPIHPDTWGAYMEDEGYWVSHRGGGDPGRQQSQQGSPLS